MYIDMTGLVVSNQWLSKLCMYIYTDDRSSRVKLSMADPRSIRRISTQFYRPVAGASSREQRARALLEGLRYLSTLVWVEDSILVTSPFAVTSSCKHHRGWLQGHLRV